MHVTSFNRNWRFREFEGLSPIWFEPKDPEVEVHLPHDFSILKPRSEDCLSAAWGGFFKGGYGLYKKTLFAKEEWRGGKVILAFDGAYMNTEVMVNDNVVAQNPYGYTAFHADLTDYLVYGGENDITVIVNAGAQPNTRWYSGAGLYRQVNLLTSGEKYIKPWGVFVATDALAETGAIISVDTEITNGGGIASLTLRSRILDPEGNEVAKARSSEPFPGGKTRKIRQQLWVDAARRWSPESPALYTLVSELVAEGDVIDEMRTSFGIRTVAFDPLRGFLLNGEAMKLRGGCVHHDNGFLGAASFGAADERRVRLLLDSGFNAVRCAHNPPSTGFLDACDRLGMLVINEAFDCWLAGKSANDYHLYFEDWWERDLCAMVLRDRNHPSVILWSTGNEIVERDGRSNGAEWSGRLAKCVRDMDSTRGVTNGICDMFYPEGKEGRPWAEATEQFAAPLDVVGYNYLYEWYEDDRKRFPGRLMCGTETFALAAQPSWEATLKNDWVIGDFVWTAMDYLGEAGIGHVFRNGEEGGLGPYPWNRAWCGDIDLLGGKRPQSHFRDCVWGRNQKPYIAVSPPDLKDKPGVLSRWSWPDVEDSWTWPGFEGETVDVEVYSACQRVELRLNGHVVGEAPAGRDAGYIARFTLPYQPGTLEAVGYEGGAEVSRSALHTAGAAENLRLTPDKARMQAGGEDLCYIGIEVVDAQGNVLPRAALPLKIQVSGAAMLQAVGNGDPVSDEPFYGASIHTWRGRALIIVRAADMPGAAKIAVTTEGLSAEIAIDSL